MSQFFAKMLCLTHELHLPHRDHRGFNDLRMCLWTANQLHIQPKATPPPTNRQKSQSVISGESNMLKKGSTLDKT